MNYALNFNEIREFLVLFPLLLSFLFRYDALTVAFYILCYCQITSFESAVLWRAYELGIAEFLESSTVTLWNTLEHSTE